ncbi:MAG: FAD-binding protein [Bacteroidetes bacterium]|nr:FAD-binding protein [Bacteroidota bacterium]
MELLTGWLNENGVKHSLDIELSEFSYMKTGGKVFVLIEPASSEEVSKCVAFLYSQNIKFKVIGATSNLLFLDDVDYSCFLTTAGLKELKLVDDAEFIAGSGHMLPDISRYALYHSITGLEGLEGIPGTVGGAVFMNAGAYGYEIKNVLKAVEFVDLTGAIQEYSVEQLKLKKRNSALKSGELSGIITKAWFRASLGNVSIIENKMEIYHSKRHKYQDFQFPNLGSMFSGSIYRALGNRDKYIYIMSTLFYLLNYKWKILRREAPLNRKWINDIIIKRLNLKYDIQPFSNKTMNCLVNRGQGTDEMIRYIEEIKTLTNNLIPIENEIVEKF